LDHWFEALYEKEKITYCSRSWRTFFFRLRGAYNPAKHHSKIAQRQAGGRAYNPAKHHSKIAQRRAGGRQSCVFTPASRSSRGSFFITHHSSLITHHSSVLRLPSSVLCPPPSAQAVLSSRLRVNQRGLIIQPGVSPAPRGTPLLLSPQHSALSPAPRPPPRLFFLRGFAASREPKGLDNSARG